MIKKFVILKNIRRLEHNVTSSTKFVKAALIKNAKYASFFKIKGKLSSILFNIKKNYKKNVLKQRTQLFQAALINKASQKTHVRTRLDFLLQRVYFCNTILYARHLIRKGLVFVNHKPIFFYSYRVKKNDLVMMQTNFQRNKSAIFFRYSNVSIASSLPSGIEVSFSTGSFIKAY